MPPACHPRQVSREGDPVEEMGLGEVLSGPGPRCSPPLGLRPHAPGSAALSRAVCAASGDPDSLQGLLQFPLSNKP